MRDFTHIIFERYKFSNIKKINFKKMFQKQNEFKFNFFSIGITLVSPNEKRITERMDSKSIQNMKMMLSKMCLLRLLYANNTVSRNYLQEKQKFMFEGKDLGFVIIMT